MTIPDDTRLQTLIDWKFTVGEQMHFARYGEYAGGFWRQFMPAGVPLPGRHPPKKIPEELYKRAQRQRRQSVS